MQTIAKEHQGLRDINDVEPYNPTRDQALFDEIRGVLAKHSALQRFGITLLHKHFDVYAGERMVELSDPLTRTLEIRPSSAPLKAGESYVETNWRFDLTSNSVNQLCFADCLKSGGGRHHEIHKKK